MPPAPPAHPATSSLLLHYLPEGPTKDGEISGHWQGESPSHTLGGTEAATHGAGGLADQERGVSQLRPQGREKGLTSSGKRSSRWPGMDGTERRRCL